MVNLDGDTYRQELTSACDSGTPPECTSSDSWAVDGEVKKEGEVGKGGRQGVDRIDGGQTYQSRAGGAGTRVAQQHARVPTAKLAAACLTTRVRCQPGVCHRISVLAAEAEVLAGSLVRSVLTAALGTAPHR